MRQEAKTTPTPNPTAGDTPPEPPPAETDGALAPVIVVAAGIAGVLVMVLLAALR